MNLIPGFSDMKSFSNATKFAATADGWGRLEVDNSDGSTSVYANFMTLPLPVAPPSATLLLEFRGISGEGKVSVVTKEAATQLRAAGDGDGQITFRPVADGEARYALVASGAESPVALLNSYVVVSAGKSLSCEARISLYEGDYQGAYVPYSGGGIARNLVPGFADMGSFVGIDRGWTPLVDGWARIEVDNSAGTEPYYAPFFSKPLADVPASATLLVEVRELSQCTVTPTARDTVSVEMSQAQLACSATDASIMATGTFRISASPTGSASPTCCLRGQVSVPKSASGAVEMRISLYEGDYEGPYVPYAGLPASPAILAL